MNEEEVKYRYCDTEHLRDYPSCFEECDQDVCTGVMAVIEPKPDECRLLDIKEEIGAG